MTRFRSVQRRSNADVRREFSCGLSKAIGLMLFASTTPPKNREHFAPTFTCLRRFAIRKRWNACAGVFGRRRCAD
jgi:hypothetical protein